MAYRSEQEALAEVHLPSSWRASVRNWVSGLKPVGRARNISPTELSHLAGATLPRSDLESQNVTQDLGKTISSAFHRQNNHIVSLFWGSLSYCYLAWGVTRGYLDRSPVFPWFYQPNKKVLICQAKTSPTWGIGYLIWLSQRQSPESYRRPHSRSFLVCVIKSQLQQQFSYSPSRREGRVHAVLKRQLMENLWVNQSISIRKLNHLKGPCFRVFEVS